jgi:ParB family transcriptional regulator, chromosome partitioning protein
MTALPHKLCLDTFQHAASGACLEASVREIFFSIQPSDLKDSPPGRRSRNGTRPGKPTCRRTRSLSGTGSLLSTTPAAPRCWRTVSPSVSMRSTRKATGYGGPGISVHGVQRRLVQADRLARAVGLDMVEAGWRPTVDNYLGRITKPRILEAVREAKGEQSAQLIDHLKKADVAKEAERLLEDTGWLPEPLRVIDDAETPIPRTETGSEDEGARLPAFLVGEGEGAVDAQGDERHLVAAK